MKRKWIILLLICIGFILIHSVIPEIKSAHESLWITENIINPLLSHFGIVADKEIVRKAAHAIEFCILTAVAFLCFKNIVRSFYCGFTFAFLDESLQVITGRGALVTDIWMGAEIISAKGRTHYGIATCVCYLADSILNQ